MPGTMTRDLLRYGRQMRVPGIGAEGQARIAQLVPTLRSASGLARRVERAYLVAAGTQTPRDPMTAESSRPAESAGPAAPALPSIATDFMPGPSAVLEGAWNALVLVGAAVRAEVPCEDP
jgi:hypothetical protein